MITKDELQKLFETKVAKAAIDEPQESASATQGGGMKNGAEQALGEKLGEKRLQIIGLMVADVKISISELAKKIGISQTAVENNIRWLKSNKIIRRIGSAKGGYWKVRLTGVSTGRRRRVDALRRFRKNGGRKGKRI